jgi:site-specific DNA-methyltransferase (adenine-specific)
LKDYGGKKDLLHPFGPLVSDVWTDIHRIKHSVKRDLHPCQLPIHLMDRLILLTTDEDDIVLDPFFFLGISSIASKHLGRKYIGFELDEKYVEISQKKLEQVEPNFKIGKSWVSFYLRDIVTIKNSDWVELEQYFIIPDPIKTIDYQKVQLKDKLLIPKDIEFQGDDDVMLEQDEDTALAGFLGLIESTKGMQHEETTAGMYECNGELFPSIQRS